MELKEFVQSFANEFDETPKDQFTASTVFKDLEEWDSLVSLSIISMVDDELEKEISSADLKKCNNIEDLYNLVSALS